MAYPNTFLVESLRTTADRLESGDRYTWSHMGRCNCGHLAQTLTGLSAAEIHRRAMRRHGDWTEQSEHFEPYCPHTGFTIDYVMDSLIEAGLNPPDIRDLEYLSNRDVLKALPGGFRYLERNNREHAILYLRTWASLLEKLLAKPSAFIPEASDLITVS
jgi:hypothetical protein